MRSDVDLQKPYVFTIIADLQGEQWHTDLGLPNHVNHTNIQLLKEDLFANILASNKSNSDDGYANALVSCRDEFVTVERVSRFRVELR